MLYSQIMAALDGVRPGDRIYIFLHEKEDVLTEGADQNALLCVIEMMQRGDLLPMGNDMLQYIWDVYLGRQENRLRTIYLEVVYSFDPRELASRCQLGIKLVEIVKPFTY